MFNKISIQKPNKNLQMKYLIFVKKEKNIKRKMYIKVILKKYMKEKNNAIYRYYKKNTFNYHIFHYILKRRNKKKNFY